MNYTKFSQNKIYEKQRIRLMMEWEWALKIVERWKIEEKQFIFEYDIAIIDFGTKSKESKVIANFLKNVHHSIEFWINYSNGIRNLYYENEKNFENYNKRNGISK